MNSHEGMMANMGKWLILSFPIRKKAIKSSKDENVSSRDSPIAIGAKGAVCDELPT